MLTALRMGLVVGLIAGGAASVHAETAPVEPGFAPALERFVETQRAECAALDNGEFEMFEGGIQHVADFNQDGVTDPIVDSGIFRCSTSATLFGGASGGRDIHVFVSGKGGTYQRFTFLAEGNIVVSLGNTAILLLAQHGSECGRSGSSLCFAAYSWADGAFAAAGGTVGSSEEKRASAE